MGAKVDVPAAEDSEGVFVNSVKVEAKLRTDVGFR